MKKISIIFCFLVIIIQFAQIIYFQRSAFLTKYDVEYWKDRYEHSQYQLPLSKRIIGDDGLFAYAGYRLINGDSPFSINIDKPPAAKYLFGLSILLFENPLYVVLVFGICSLIVFFFIANHLLKDVRLAVLATTFLFLDPLFFTQLWITGLDLIQLFFLLLNIFLLINIKKLRGYNIFVILGSGLSLGLFVEVKPPVLFPIIFILETIFLWYRGLKKESLFFFLSLMVGVFLPYLRFMFLGNGIIDILKVHKFMASIYLESQLKTHVGAIWLTLFAGKFPNIVTGSLISVSEWWIMWPVVTSLGIIMAILSLFSRRTPIFHKGLSIFILTLLVVLTLIPSYPRYLVIALPFLYLFGIKFTQIFFNKAKLIVLFLALLVYGTINSFFFLIPKPEVSLSGFYYNLSNLYFQDIYQENIVDTNTLNLTRSQFRYITNKSLEDAGVKKIEVKELTKNIDRFATSGDIKIGLTYKTQDLGSFYEEKTVKLVQRDGKWKINWDWDLVVNGFLPDYILQTEKIIGKRGALIGPNIKILVQDGDGYLVSVNPEKIDLKREQEMLKFIGAIGDVEAPYLQNAYLENSLPGRYVPLVTPFVRLKEPVKIKLLSFPGVKVAPYRSRIYNELSPLSIKNTLYTECCSKIYSSYNYHGVEGLEKNYDLLLSGYDGGSITINDKNGNIIKTVLEKEAKNGQDVIVPL